jgi:phosphoribosylamine--glycine ligase
MCVSAGYPGNYEKGKEISGLEKLTRKMVFHAGTKTSDDTVVTAGGRVLAVTTLADTLQDAIAGSYTALSEINFEGMYSRKDIGKDLL